MRAHAHLRSVLPVVVLGALAAGVRAGEVPAVRVFEFSYTARVTALPEGAREVRIWMPLPRVDPGQKIRALRFGAGPELPPGTGGGPAWEVRETREGRLGNRVLFAAGRPGPGPVEVFYACEVERAEVRMEDLKPAPLLEQELKPYLLGDRLAPLEGIASEWAEKAAADARSPLEEARRLYDRVFDHMRYSKEGVGWGRGSVEWACREGYGNCTDYHALFTAMARARKIPCRFEIGFPLPHNRGAGEIPGYHCWAWFHIAERGWVPVDISEADKNPHLKEYFFGSLTEDRVALTVGRDLELSPAPRTGPLNFFIYPHVEVDGAPHEKVERKVTFRDLPADGR